MLQLLECLRLDLSYSFASHPHHLANFFKGKGPEVTRDPCAIEKGFVFQTPLAGRILTGLGDEMAFFLAFVKTVQRRISSVIILYTN